MTYIVYVKHRVGHGPILWGFIGFPVKLVYEGRYKYEPSVSPCVSIRPFIVWQLVPFPLHWRQLSSLESDPNIISQPTAWKIIILDWFCCYHVCKLQWNLSITKVKEPWNFYFQFLAKVFSVKCNIWFLLYRYHSTERGNVIKFNLI